MGNKEKPLVSCLCVTRNRDQKLKSVIQHFRNQTYQNKELLIVYESDDIKTKECSKSISEENVRWIEVPASPKLSLGKLRNLSIALSSGDYFCQWDDDDWYHRERIEMQLNCLLESHKSACILAYWLIYDAIDETAYLSQVEPWAGTILCRKDIISETNGYPDIARHEDTHFVWNSLTLKNLAPLFRPSLYIYVYHGRNTFERAHFQELFARGQALPKYFGKLLKNILDNSMSYAEACEMLLGKSFLQEMNYFHMCKYPAAVLSH